MIRRFANDEDGLPDWAMAPQFRQAEWLYHTVNPTTPLEDWVGVCRRAESGRDPDATQALFTLISAPFAPRLLAVSGYDAALPELVRLVSSQVLLPDWMLVQLAVMTEKQ